MTDFQLDASRAERVGFGEAVFCAGKTPPRLTPFSMTPPAVTSRCF